MILILLFENRLSRVYLALGLGPVGSQAGTVCRSYSDSFSARAHVCGQSYLWTEGESLEAKIPHIAVTSLAMFSWW